MGETIGAIEILERLTERYAAPKWAAFPELRNAAGFDANRRCDFWAINTWPSSGFLRVAVEIKVARNDFLRELDRPGKREDFEAISHEFYFAAPSGLIKPTELPDGVGLLEATAKTIRAKVRAKQHKPEPMDISQLAVLLKETAVQRARERERLDQFAEFAGRVISLDDLRRLTELFHLRNQRQLKIEARHEVERERRESAKDGAELGAWWSAIRQLKDTARDALGLTYRDEPVPKRVEEWLRNLPHRRIGRIARDAGEFSRSILEPKQEESDD